MHAWSGCTRVTFVRGSCCRQSVPQLVQQLEAQIVQMPLLMPEDH